MMDGWYWHKCAEEARIMAETFTSAEAKQAMLGIAERYDFLAESAERQLARNKPKSA
jgi:hypothetical protein